MLSTRASVHVVWLQPRELVCLGSCWVFRLLALLVAAGIAEFADCLLLLALQNLLNACPVCCHWHCRIFWLLALLVAAGLAEFADCLLCLPQSALQSLPVACPVFCRRWHCRICRFLTLFTAIYQHCRAYQLLALFLFAAVGVADFFDCLSCLPPLTLHNLPIACPVCRRWHCRICQLLVGCLSILPLLTLRNLPLLALFALCAKFVGCLPILPPLTLQSLSVLALFVAAGIASFTRV